MGEGPELDPLHWDVLAYFILAGAVHDAAVSAWGIKGWYDYIRPISAIRSMADRGQSSDPELDSYHIGGIALEPGYVELVSEEDPLAGEEGEHVGKIKLFTWRGHDFIDDPAIDVAGVGWILAENWWPYQRPSFITPPFAGYISGHSTFSRAAAEVMTLITGDPFFPGGIGEFFAPKNEFLVFEEGPSVDVTLQWATYRDASDQTSLSRIWGGIHPPADDVPGRLIGERLGKEAFEYALCFIYGSAALPLANFDADIENKTVIITNTSVNGVDFEWDFGDGSTDSISTPTHTYSEIGEYDIQLITSNRCGTDTTVLTVEVLTSGATNLSGNARVSISPNPNNGTFSLEIGEAQGTAYIRVYDIQGRVVLVVDESTTVEGKRLLSIPDPLPGLYYAIVEVDGLRSVVKFVVE